MEARSSHEGWKRRHIPSPKCPLEAGQGLCPRSTPLKSKKQLEGICVLHVNVNVKVAQLCPTLCDSMDCSPPGSSVRGILQARILEWVAIPFQGIFPNQGSNPGLPQLRADSLLSEPPRKPKNTGVGGLSHLYGNFLSRELNRGLLHCRLSYQGSPGSLTAVCNPCTVSIIIRAGTLPRLPQLTSRRG